MYLLRLETEARIIWQIAVRLLLLGAFSNCVPPDSTGWNMGSGVRGGGEFPQWRISLGSGAFSHSRWPRNVAATPTKEKNRDNKALIPPRTTASIWQSRLYRQEDGRAETGPGWTRLPEHGGRQLHQGEAEVQAAISCWDCSVSLRGFWWPHLTFNSI